MSLAANNPSALAADPRNDGKVAIVTGASAGIGAGIAIELAKAGFTKFALVARNAEKLAEVEAACKAAGAKEVLVLQKDLFKPDEVCQDIIDSENLGTQEQVRRSRTMSQLASGTWW